jgi:large conductance mechanosensitive channel
MWKEFRAFLTQTNALGLAIAVVIAVAFGAVIASLVADILMPPIGMLLGKVDLSNLYLNLSGGSYPTLAEAKKAGAVTINYGVFINTVITFVVVAFVVFLIGRKFLPAPAPGPATKACPYCGMEILGTATRCPHCTSQLAG